MQEQQGGLSRRTLWLLNGVAAFVILIVFMLTIMTAIAQQEVVNRIKAEQLGLGYSAALSIRDEAAKRQRELDRLAENEQIASDKLQRAQSKLRQASTSVEDAWQNFAPFLQRIARARVCDITVP